MGSSFHNRMPQSARPSRVHLAAAFFFLGALALGVLVLLFVAGSYQLELASRWWSLTLAASALTLFLTASVVRMGWLPKSWLRIRMPMQDTAAYIENLEQELDRARDIAQAASDWFWETGPDMKVCYLSGRFGEIAGVSSAYLLGKRREEFADMNDPDADWPGFDAKLAAREPVRDFTYRVILPSGDCRYWRISGAPYYDHAGRFLGYRGAGSDVTRLKQAEQSLRESNERHALALKSINEGVYDWDIRSGSIYYSDRVRDALGFGKGDLKTPADWLGRIHPEDLPIYRQRLVAHLKGQSDHFECEFRYRALDDSWRWVRQRGVVQRDSTGWAYRMGGSAGDITAHKDAEATLKEREFQLKVKLAELQDAHSHLEHQSARLRDLAEELKEAKTAADAANNAKSDFLAIMSHELRTPLNGILGMAEMFGCDDMDATQTEQVNTIIESGRGLLRLLDDILDISKIEAGKIDLEVVDFDLVQVIRSVEALWGPRIRGKDIGFAVTLDPNVTTVLQGDPSRIRQILSNYVSNAEKFTSRGEILLRVRQETQSDGRLELRFEVKDSGIGIAPEAQAKLFQKFVQADCSLTRTHGGSGLGLAICKDLAALMGGTVGAESEPGTGSTFWFTVCCQPGDSAKLPANLRHDAEKQLPAKPKCASSESARPAPPLPAPRKPELVPMEAGGDADRSLRILVAEDNAVNQAVLKAMLVADGHDIDFVGNGLEAVRAAMQSPYDLILMDVQMPEMDGVSATKWIREIDGEAGNVPIVAVTAHAMAGDRERYLAAGMNDYVSKPVDRMALRAAVVRCARGATPGAPLQQAEAPETAAPCGPLSRKAEESINGLLDDLKGLSG